MEAWSLDRQRVTEVTFCRYSRSPDRRHSDVFFTGPPYPLAGAASAPAPQRKASLSMTGPISQALIDFRAKPQSRGWLTLPFFQDGSAEAVAAKVDAVIATGAQVLPPPDAVFTSISLTPLEKVKVVVLGQDPYPTPGDSHGLAFSYRGSRRLPASLRTILREMAEDLDVPMPASGDLSKWARQGVLLINTALTVEAGQSGAHMKFG